MQNASNAVRWIDGSLRYKLPYHHQNILSQTDKTESTQPVVFLGKKPSYRLPLVSAIEETAGKHCFSSLVIGDDIQQVSSDFIKLIEDCPPWFHRRTGISLWEFGQKGLSGQLTLNHTARYGQLSESYDSVHIAGFDTDPETFVKLANKLRSVSKKITWYPFKMFPRDHPFLTDVVIPAIHKKALFLSR